MNVKRFALVVVVGGAVCVAGWLALFPATSSAFIEPGHFSFPENDFRQVERTQWLPDCDQDGFPDLAVVHRVPKTMIARAKPYFGYSSGKKRVSASLYSGRTGKPIGAAVIDPAGGRCIEIREYKKSSRELVTVRRERNRNFLYEGSELVASNVKSPTDLRAYWRLEKTDAWVAASGLRDLIPDGVSNFVAVGMAFDLQSQRRVFVAFVQRRSSEMFAGAWIWLNYNTAELLKAETIFQAEAENRGGVIFAPVRVCDLNGDQVLDCELIDIDFETGLKLEPHSYLQIDGAGKEAPRRAAREAGPPQYVRNITALENFDQPVRVHAPQGQARAWVIELLNPVDYSVRRSATLPKLTFAPADWTVVELKDLNGDRIPELAFEAGPSSDEYWAASSVLLDGATMKPFFEISR